MTDLTKEICERYEEVTKFVAIRPKNRAHLSGIVPNAGTRKSAKKYEYRTKVRYCWVVKPRTYIVT